MLLLSDYSSEKGDIIYKHAGMVCGDVVTFVLWDKVGGELRKWVLSVSGEQPSFLLRFGEHDMSRAGWASVEMQWRCAGEQRQRG